jgi:hypothetical protein
MGNSSRYSVAMQLYTYHIVDLEATPQIFVLGIQVWQLVKLDNKIVYTLGFKRVRECLGNQNAEHVKEGRLVLHRISKEK